MNTWTAFAMGEANRELDILSAEEMEMIDNG